MYCEVCEQVREFYRKLRDGDTVEVARNPEIFMSCTPATEENGHGHNHFSMRIAGTDISCNIFSLEAAAYILAGVSFLGESIDMD